MMILASINVEILVFLTIIASCIGLPHNQEDGDHKPPYPLDANDDEPSDSGKFYLHYGTSAGYSTPGQSIVDRQASNMKTSYTTRHKRAIMKDEGLRWDKGIVPYIFDRKDPEFVREVRRRQLTIERYTCIRFVKWTNDTNGITTNDKLNLGHQNYLRISWWNKCVSDYGNKRRNRGQQISCCPHACLHELGHALGLVHEQRTTDPVKNLMIRIDLEHTISEFNTYRKNDVSALVGYDTSSLMHYKRYDYSKPSGNSFVRLYPEIHINSGHYYMLMELSLAYKCVERNCSESTLICENDGYLTLVENQCRCRCPPGLDPDTGCTTIINNTTKTQQFPGGSYALPEPLHGGCAEPSAQSGTRIHYTDGPNTISNKFGIKGVISGRKVEQSFCVTTNSDSKDIWPVGNYCIYRKGGTCPENFREDYIQYDDNPKNNVNSVDGALPDGVFGENTRLEYCCRDDGTPGPMFLPNQKPFVLFKGKGSQDCPHVQGMHYYQNKYTIVNNRKKGLAEGESPVRSKLNSISQTTKLCYYKPAMIDCGKVFYLDKDKKTVTFSSPSEQEELDCTWLIKAPKGQKVRLKFDDLYIASPDWLEIRYFRVGQKGFKVRINKKDQTFQSTNNTILLRLSTYNQTKTKFTATASVTLDEDLCYNPGDRGTSYAGNVNFTRFFEPCLPWAEVGHCRYSPFKAMGRSMMLDGNYCRNPDYTTGDKPWCYTKAKQCKRNYCDPCLYGSKYDNFNQCKKHATVGICDYLGIFGMRALSDCAKTCDVQLPKTPTKHVDITCGRPPKVKEGMIENGFIKASYKVGDTVTYRCIKSNETISRVCLTSGQWSQSGYSCNVCPLGFSFTKGRCYKYVRKVATYAHASEICKRFGASLVFPKTKKSNNFIKKMRNRQVSKKMWLGVTYNDTEGTWKDFDNNKIKYSNWRTERNGKTYKNCVIMFGNGKWADVSCHRKFGFICSTSKSVECTEWDEWNECPRLFERNPKICAKYPTFAEKMCPLTCGICKHRHRSKMCNVEAPINGNMSPNNITIAVGASVDYACNNGYFIASGDSSRGCRYDGELSGTPVRCQCSIDEYCPYGWIGSGTTRKCYRYFEDLKSASTVCEKHEGTLAGLSLNQRHDCVVMAPNGAWDSKICTAAYRYTCQIPLKRCLRGWIYDRHSQHCYRLFHELKNQSDAVKACSSINAELASAKDKETNSFLKGIKNTMYNIWLPVKRVEGKWKWADGEELDDEDVRGEDKKNRKNCSVIKRNKWVKRSCWKTLNYICKMPEKDAPSCDVEGRAVETLQDCVEKRVKSVSMGFTKKRIRTWKTISSVILRRSLTKFKCELGVTYGFVNNTVWVDKGCKADLTICRHKTL